MRFSALDKNEQNICKHLTVSEKGFKVDTVVMPYKKVELKSSIQSLKMIQEATLPKQFL